MKDKIYILLLIVSSLVVYIEWDNNAMYLFQLEAQVFSAILSDIGSVIHPFIFIPLAGQLFLIINLFRRKPGRILTFAGMACIGLLLGLIVFIGTINGNLKMILSTLPFIIVSILIFSRWINALRKGEIDF